MKALILVTLLTATSVMAEETPAPAAAPAPAAPAAEEGRDSKWRLLLHLSGGSLGLNAENEDNTLKRDYETGSGGALGILTDYRPNKKFGLEFGIKLLAVSHKAKNSDLSLSLSYLGVPIEGRYRITPLFKRSQLFVKGGLTYLLLMTAGVGDGKRNTSGGGGWDDDDWDAYPSPPSKGNYRGSFVKSNLLLSAGIGADLLLFQIGDSFNMSIIPEITYYRSLGAVAKSGEFGSSVYMNGILTGFAISAGF